MVWIGVLLLLAGGLMALGLDGDLAGLDLTVAGFGVLAAGAALLIAGILRLNRARRAGGPAKASDGPYKTGRGKTIAMISAVLYIVSPIDFIPDVLLPVGIVDDATAFTWLLIALGQEYTRRRSSRRALAPAAPRDAVH